MDGKAELQMFMAFWRRRIVLKSQSHPARSGMTLMPPLQCLLRQGHRGVYLDTVSL